VSETTRRLVGGLFDYRNLGHLLAEGLPEPMPAWQVIGPSPIESRFEALRTGATPLVGREEELQLLLRRWRVAASGEGRVVLLSGEPGIGKSRIALALMERLSDEPHTRLRSFCSPHHQDTALYPTITQLERAEGFGATTRTSNGSTSSRRCWHGRPTALARLFPCSQRCCRFRPTVATRL